MIEHSENGTYFFYSNCEFCFGSFRETATYSEAILLLVLPFLWREESYLALYHERKGCNFHFYWMSCPLDSII
jgi:hypothetical protein